MLNDLAALAPPLVMCVGFVIAVAAFIRHEVRRGQREGTADSPGRISGRSRIAGRSDEPGGAGGAENGTGKDPGSTGQDELRSA